MKSVKYAKYVLIAGLLAAMIISPRTVAKVAASGEEQAILEMYAEAESPAHKKVEGTMTQMEGFYLAKEVNGVALIPTAGKPANTYVKVTDTNKDASSAAVAVANNAAAQVGAVVGPCVNVNYGTMEKGKFVDTIEGSQGIVYIGIPANFRVPGARYGLVAVYQGGGYKVYESSSTNPNAIACTVDQAITPKVMYAMIRFY